MAIWSGYQPHGISTNATHLEAIRTLISLDDDTFAAIQNNQKFWVITNTNSSTVSSFAAASLLTTASYLRNVPVPNQNDSSSAQQSLNMASDPNFNLDINPNMDVNDGSVLVAESPRDLERILKILERGVTVFDGNYERWFRSLTCLLMSKLVIYSIATNINTGEPTIELNSSLTPRQDAKIAAHILLLMFPVNNADRVQLRTRSGLDATSKINIKLIFTSMYKSFHPAISGPAHWKDQLYDRYFKSLWTIPQADFSITKARSYVKHIPDAIRGLTGIQLINVMRAIWLSHYDVEFATAFSNHKFQGCQIDEKVNFMNTFGSFDAYVDEVVSATPSMANEASFKALQTLLTAQAAAITHTAPATPSTQPSSTGKSQRLFCLPCQSYKKRARARHFRVNHDPATCPWIGRDYPPVAATVRKPAHAQAEQLRAIQQALNSMTATLQQRFNAFSTQ